MDRVTGDLLLLAESGEFDVLVHGCNCQNIMGAGIAKAIKARFPEAYEADQATEKSSRKKLGTFSSAQVVRGAHTFWVVNAYTQFDIKGPKPRVDYRAIDRVFESIAQQFSGLRIGYPMIGAGLAGGDWNRIAQIINEKLAGERHCLVALPEN